MKSSITLNLNPSDITCDWKDFLEAEKFLQPNLKAKLKSLKISEKVKQILKIACLFQKKLDVSEEDMNCETLLSAILESDNFHYQGIAHRVITILAKSKPHLSKLWHDKICNHDYLSSKLLLSSIVDLKNIIEALNNSAAVQIISKDWIILDCNEKFDEISWNSRDDYIWKPAKIMSSWMHSSEFWENMWETILSWSVFSSIFCNKRKDWSFYWTKTTITPYKNEFGVVEKFIVIRHDVTNLVLVKRKLKEKNSELEMIKQSLADENQKLIALSNTDALTSLYNRRYFDFVLQKEVSNSEITWNNISIVLFDIDNFKFVNDTYWHHGWDDVLKRIGKILLEITRQGDIPARFWGEEFVIILPNTDSCGALTFANKLQNNIKQQVFNADDWTEFKITLSIGLSQLKERETKESLFIRTDSLLYNAKQTWKNKICL